MAGGKVIPPMQLGNDTGTKGVANSAGQPPFSTRLRGQVVVDGSTHIRQSEAVNFIILCEGKFTAPGYFSLNQRNGMVLNFKESSFPFCGAT